MILSWIIFTSTRHDHTDEQHRPCVAWQFKSEQKRAVNNAQKGYIVEEGDFPERLVTRSGSESKLITMKVETNKNDLLQLMLESSVVESEDVDVSRLEAGNDELEKEGSESNVAS
ncbi:hypothetical protein AVEN_97037-1 [Araneus ventricosus]|uniref:Uncharacterized protein n=1 Tax=Araneus ventricosus TaxID=182803 RepID=A0A4Y2QYS3_ARAVE|nr:hypothetical protein AVEN_97037-1 [Araneus ventricosus]